MKEGTIHIFKPRKTRVFLLLLGSLIFVSLGVYMFDKDPALGYVSIFFFGLCFFITCVSLYPNLSYLKLTPEGFEVKGLWTHYFREWSEVKDFEIGYLRGTKMICYNFTNKQQKDSKGRKFSKQLSGYEAGIILIYDVKAKELLALMKEYKKQSLSLNSN